MQISLSGSAGLIGTALSKKFIEKGWMIKILDRQSFSMPEDEFTVKNIEGSDIIINLAGAPVSKKWTESYKKEILESRITTTRKIVNGITASAIRPKLLISVSAVGIYDSDHLHTENSRDFAGNFLSEVCRNWESEAMKAEPFCRVVIPRIGVVLSREGGALKKLYLPFTIGLGAKIGRGDQPFPFIHIDDLVNVFLYTIETESLRGVVNAVAPQIPSNKHFTKTFGKVLQQPAFLTIPIFLLKIRLGEGSLAVTQGQNVVPEKLLKSGFEFKFPTIEKALMNLYR